ncbi:unnamed protein product [Rotaria sordida]|uniref:Choline/carnitine acyltransferase domain-containing protein n=1 Tax=Rotaria sordida TaxID=392033 RepID=A0A813WGT7_9BILA|nr:unnamed protein product [Rotaria sordida]
MSLVFRRTYSTLLQNRNVYFDLYQRQCLTSFSLPVPTLAETARKYLKTVAPLLNNDEFNETKKIVEQFRQESEPLQELLLKRAQTEENWKVWKQLYEITSNMFGHVAHMVLTTQEMIVSYNLRF